MKVADLQQILVDLAPLLGTCGVKPAALADLKKVREGLQPFSQLSVADFASFLDRAETYRRNGEVPTKALKGGTGRTGARTAGRATVDANAVAQQVRALYDRAADPSTTDEHIDQQTAQLGQLSKDGLVTVAEAIELLGMKAKKKDDIVTAIRLRIKARRGATQRAGLIDRPASPGQPPASTEPPRAGHDLADVGVSGATFPP
jgi:hypothetical protein